MDGNSRRVTTSTRMERFCAVSVSTPEASQRALVVDRVGRRDSGSKRKVPKMRLAMPVAAATITSVSPNVSAARRSTNSTLTVLRPWPIS